MFEMFFLVFKQGCFFLTDLMEELGLGDADDIEGKIIFVLILFHVVSLKWCSRCL